MGIQLALQEGSMTDTRDRISYDNNLTFYEKAQRLAGIQQAYERPDPNPTTFGHVLTGAIGAAMAFGLAKGIGSQMGLPDDSINKLTDQASDMGGFLAMGKEASVLTERRHAFRLGFIKAAVDAGYFDKEAEFNPFALVIDPIIGVSRASRSVGEHAGAIAGSADSPDEGDKDITGLRVETQLLRHELEKVKAERQNRILQQVLAKRHHKA